MTPERRIVERRMVTRWGQGWQFSYPEGSTITVKVDDTPTRPLTAWTRSPEREPELG